MGSNMQTGLLLVLGTIASVIGWFAFYPGEATDSVTDQALAVMGDPDKAKIGILLGYGGMLSVLIGLLNVARPMAMAGGKGASYANIATILLILSAAGIVIGTGMELGVTEGNPLNAQSAQGAITLMAVNAAGFSAIGITMGLAILLLGLGACLGKELQLLGAAALVITGVLLLVSTFVDDVDTLGFAAWIAFMVTSLVVGGLKLKPAK